MLRHLQALMILLIVCLFGLADGYAGKAARGAKPGRAAKSSVNRGASGPAARRARPRSSKSATLGSSRKPAQWKARRSRKSGDTGLRDHAARHSDQGPTAYLRLGQTNVAKGRMLKGGGKFPKANYHIRKLAKDSYSMTITDHRGKILSIDTWKAGGTPLRREAIERGLKASGVTPPKGFWNKL